MATADDVIRIAQNEVGTIETGQNYNPYGSELGENGVAWCGIFACWALLKAGMKKPPFNYASATAYAYAAEKQGWGTYHSANSGYIPRKGDLFIRNYDGTDFHEQGHVGFVAEDSSGNGYFKTIEGNAGPNADRVYQNNGKSVVGLCFVTPPYDSEEAIAPQYTNFPKYNLSESAIKDIATCITGETGGIDIVACRQEASQMANLNEVYYNRSATEDNLVKSLHGGWYSKDSWTRGCTQTAIDAVRFVIIEGKRTLPRYVTEHDTFPNDITNAKSRADYSVGDEVHNCYGSNYYFYCFFGSDKKGDISGYFQINYKKYQSDIPWTEGAAESSTSDAELIETTKPITKSVIKSEEGARGSVRTNPMDGKTVAEFDGQVELYIINKDGVIFYPPVEEGMTLTQERYGSPSVLKFNVLKTPNLNFLEGSQVVLRVRGVNMFYGYVFTKGRSKDGFISCTAYDQLRYFKNKECYIYQDKTASELVKMIAEDFNLSVGTLEDTGYKIPQRVEDDVTLFDIVQTALSETLINTGKMYFLYDDFGKLCVGDSSKKLLDIVIDKETAEDFDYKTSIDDNVCTRVKFYYDNEQTGERELYIANNTEKQNEWGVLQYSGKLEDGEDGAAKASTYLEIYNEKTRKLTIKGANGIPEARAGFSVYVDLDLGDIVQKNFMLIEKSVHTFSHCEHSMDLTLRGGDFVT